MFSPTHCQKTLEMQIPKAVAEKAGLCGENPEPLPLLAPARAVWACKPHPPQQGALGSRKPGSLSAVGSHPAMCYLRLSDAERAQTCNGLRSKSRSRKPGLQPCFPDMSSDGEEPWKQERRPFGDRERFPMRPFDCPLQSHVRIFLPLSDPHSAATLSGKADTNPRPLPPLFTDPTTREGISALLIQFFFIQVAYTVKFILI